MCLCACAGSVGGGIYCSLDSHPGIATFGLYLSNISANLAQYGGGMAATSYCNISIHATRFVCNRAEIAGGGIAADHEAFLAVQCSLFASNGCFGTMVPPLVTFSLTLKGNKKHQKRCTLPFGRLITPR